MSTRTTRAAFETAAEETSIRIPSGADQVDRRRVLPTLDLAATATIEKDETAALLTHQVRSATHFVEGLRTLKNHFTTLVVEPTAVLPGQVIGTLHQPDGSPAANVLVGAQAPAGLDKSAPWPDPSAATDEKGFFRLRLPAGAPAAAGLTLSFKGARKTLTQVFSAEMLGKTGVLGSVTLPEALEPLPHSVVASLLELLADTVAQAPQAPATPAPSVDIKVKMGEGESPLVFHYNQSQERFPYGVLVRLVEPRPSILTKTFEFAFNERTRFQLALWNNAWTTISDTKSSFTDRVPIDQPLSVDGFRDRIVGNEHGVISPAETVPMSGTLGLGYVVRMAQKWTPAGLSLGDLVYSLPLAPGEQQRVAVFEQRQSLSTLEVESLDETEQQFQAQQADSTAQATFDSAFIESIRGSSSYATHAESSSWGAAGGLGLAIGPLVIGGGAAGGGGSADTSGSARQALDGARNYASHAVQTMHSSTERQAYARRRAQRTGMRLATATDAETATTKVITNNNRTRALTVQYWEVLRHFDVSTAVDGVSLVCFVPLEVVRFLPAGQPVDLNPSLVNSRPGLLARYGALAKHSDVLKTWVPRKYAVGLELLEEFAANPLAVPDLEAFGEDVVNVSLTGAFLPFEDLYLSLRTKQGTRVGPIRMTGPVEPLPDVHNQPTKAFSSRSDLMANLHARRDTDAPTVLTANLALPATVAPDDVVGFELSRAWRPLNYTLAPAKDNPAHDALIKALESNTTEVDLGPFLISSVSALLDGVRMNGAELEQEFGGPNVWNFSAQTLSPGGGIPETYASGFFASKMPLPVGTFPIPALQVKPLLRFNDLLKVEQTLQHVVRNTVTYSKAVWMSMTPEERAILLEGYTVGVPSGGLEDASQHIPLLNCVANQVLGYYGNCMILPFSIPVELANSMGVPSPDGETTIPLTTGAIQDALTNFHRQGFAPPVSRVTLPTHGVLGEAVLGQSPAAEKIDLTRFWNWSDSPIPQADDVKVGDLNRAQPLTGATAPSSLTALPTMITNVNGAPTADTELVKALISGQNTKDLPDLTGAAQLAELQGKTLATAESARADALGKAQGMATEALKQLPDILKANAAAKADAKKEAKESEDSSSAKQKQAMESLKTNAETYQSIADAKATQDEANAYAADVVKAATGGTALPIDQASQLFDAYKDASHHPKGSKAFLIALGLQSA